MIAFVIAFALLSSTLDAQDEETVPILEEWRSVLLYGIDREVLSVLSKIREAEELSLNAELHAVLQQSASQELKKAILEYFADMGVEEAEESAVEILDFYDEAGTDLLVATIRYLSEIKAPISEILVELIGHEEEIVAAAAIRALGKTGDATNVQDLLERLDEDEYSDELKAAVILALGSLKAPEAVEKLIEIVRDQDANRIWRMYACDSLGKIGDEKAIPVLRALLAERDSLIRAYAVSGLTQFGLDKETIALLMQGLRDSNWQVRVACAKALAASEATQAIDILKYKAQHDPEMQVRSEAVRALAAIGTADVFEFLREQLLSDRVAMSIRELSLSLLVEKDLAASLSTIRDLVQREKSTPDTKVLEFIGRILSVAEADELEDVYAIFLEMKDPIMQIYAVRGIGRNRLKGMRAQLENLVEHGPHPAVRKEALSALARWE